MPQIQSPTVTEMELVSPTDSLPPEVKGNRMKKELGLLEGCAIILGIIFGSGKEASELKKNVNTTISSFSGIFISPKGVIQEVNAPGTSIVIWILCGVLSMIGGIVKQFINNLHNSFKIFPIFYSIAICYAELGTCIPKSGGDYAYINEAFGNLPSFLYIWDAVLIFV